MATAPDPTAIPDLETPFDAAFYWLCSQASNSELDELGSERTKAIYKTQYWDALACESLPKGLDIAVFDCAVHQGLGIARRLLCKTLGISPDDPELEISDDIFAEFNSLTVFNDFLALRLRRYAFSPGKEVQMQTWSQRILELYAFALCVINEDQTDHSGEANQLTAITGIGPATAKKLIAFGISSVQQIADLDEAKKAEIEQALSIKGQIDQKGWVAQAQALIEKGFD